MPETKSFTIRVPVDLLSQIEQKAGDDSKSRVFIDLLKRGLESTPDNSSKTDVRLTSDIQDLQQRQTTIREELDNVLHRLSKLEGSNTNPEDRNSTPKSVLKENPKVDLLFDEEKYEIKEVEETTNFLVNILNTQNNNKSWNHKSLRKYREGSRASRWHSIGNVSFTYANKTVEKPRKQHVWLVRKAKASH